MRFEHIRILAVGRFLAELKQGQYIDTKRAAVVCCTDEPVNKGTLLPIPHCCVQFYDTEDPKAFGTFSVLANEFGIGLLQGDSFPRRD